MTAIAGIIQLDDHAPIDQNELQRMQNLLAPYGRDEQKLWHSNGAGLVRTLCRITSEDSLDCQPLQSRNGNLVLVFDGRVDNRTELAGLLDISPRQASLMADSDFVMAAFEHWGKDCLQHMLGDFALAVWEKNARRLFLARDPLGYRPLYWYRNSRFFAFGSLCKALFALPEVPKALCETRMADYLALLPMKGPESFYQDIFRIEPGHFLILENGQVRTQRYHSFNFEHRIVLKNDDDYVATARELLDKAVSCRLRSAGGVASHLSSGLDSSTITATAARLLATQGKKLLAFTAVPREGFAGPTRPGSHADEGPAAAALAARFPNIEHILFRSGKRTPLDDLQEKVERFDRAPLNLCNHVWIDGIQVDAANRGARVILTGQMGNTSISHNGHTRLPSLLRQGKWIQWIVQTRALIQHSNLSPKKALLESFGPFVPEKIWQAYSKRRGLDWQHIHDYSAIHPDLIRRTNLQDRARQLGWDLTHRPWADGQQMREAILQWFDLGDHFSACVANGIEMRDPTSDIRLLTFCLAIPEEQYLKNGQPRWLLRRMMQDVLPPETFLMKTKGIQAADWYEGANSAKEDIKAWVDRLSQSPEAARYLDIKELAKSIDQWPQEHWASKSTVQRYRSKLLRGISVGAFINYVEDSNR